MTDCYLGVDIGSSFTKFVVVDEFNNIILRKVIKSLNRNKHEQQEITNFILSNYNIKSICATGYGRDHFKNANVIKTELVCASIGISTLFPYEKTIIDIGGEDVKIVTSNKDGKVLDFYMNTKCAAGTGSFITEIAEKAEIDITMMSELASKSKFNHELNSFCTVFAKTEIMKWLFDNVPIEDIAMGIYLSIANRIMKLRVDKNLPVYLIGGVISYHPFFKNVLEEKFNSTVYVPEFPQLITSFGAAVLAKNNFLTKS